MLFNSFILKFFGKDNETIKKTLKIENKILKQKIINLILLKIIKTDLLYLNI